VRGVGTQHHAIGGVFGWEKTKIYFLCVAAETFETCYLPLSFVPLCFSPSIICCKALKLYMVTACHAEDSNFCGENYGH
jgi:hypothetical protein